MVMSLIESLTRIKNAVYGREVREAIHDGVFRANQIADGADTKADNTQIRQDAVEDFNNQVIQEMTDKDVISAPEIIQMRDGEATASARLDRDFGEIKDKLSDSAISPDDFEGSDYEKVQSAIDEAIESKKAIRLTRSYNVTNTIPLKLNKKNTRWTLSFIGEGGGFVKTNSGFMFDSDNDLSADINFTSVFFEGVSGSGMTLFNGDKIIILNTTLCVYYNVDKKLSSTNYIQSMRSLNDRVTGGQGYFISTPSAFDYLDDGTLCEVRDSYFEQTAGDPNKPYHQLYSARFTGGTIEGISGTAIKVRNTENLLIDGMYMEQNGTGHIVFDKSGYYSGVTISNNYAQSSASNPVPFIKWGGTIINAKTENNRANVTAVNDAREVTKGYILSYRDVMAYTPPVDLDPQNRILKRDTGPKIIENGFKTTLIDDNIIKMTSRIEQQSLAAGLNNQYVVSFDSDIYMDDIISVQIRSTGTRDYTYHYTRDVSNKKNLYVSIYNRSTVDTVVSIWVTVLQFDRGSSVIG